MVNRIKKILILLTVGATFAIIGIFSINAFVDKQGSKHIYEMSEVPNADTIIVLGAYVHPSGNVSVMLKDRLSVAYDLYASGKAPKIIVSGDHGTKNYDEVNTMKEFLMDKGVPNEDIFMDHAGFSTYETMYRARDVFKVENAIIVTQEYHLKRAVFNARELGIIAHGVPADLRNYGHIMKKYNTREIAARNKDFVWAKLIQPKPTYLGEEIPVTGDGSVTND